MKLRTPVSVIPNAAFNVVLGAPNFSKMSVNSIAVFTGFDSPPVTMTRNEDKSRLSDDWPSVRSRHICARRKLGLNEFVTRYLENQSRRFRGLRMTAEGETWYCLAKIINEYTPLMAMVLTMLQPKLHEDEIQSRWRRDQSLSN